MPSKDLHFSPVKYTLRASERAGGPSRVEGSAYFF